MGSSTYLPENITNPIDEALTALKEAREVAGRNPAEPHNPGVGASTNREYTLARIREAVACLNQADAVLVAAKPAEPEPTAAATA